MNCPNCGKEVEEQQKFCSACGTALNTIEEDTNNQNDKIDNNYLWKSIACAVGIFVVIAFVGTVAQNNNNSYSTATKNTDTVTEVEQIEQEQEELKPTAPRNCVYETSDGVCFTTKVFKPEPMNYYDCTGGLTTYYTTEQASKKTQECGVYQCEEKDDSWAGAMYTCHEYGFRLANSQELSSLASDIYGVRISNVSDRTSYMLDGTTHNTKTLNSIGINSMGGVFSLWENESINSHSAWHRSFSYRDTTRRSYMRKAGVLFEPMAICVYDPYGVAKKQYTIPKQVTQETPKPEQPKAPQNYNKEAENDLF